MRYSQIIGSLMYLASATRPDISFAVSKLSRYMSNPGDDHWRALKRVLCYLKGTISFGIHYSGHLAVLEGYSDSNWISDIDQIYTTSGYVFTLGGGIVSWRLKGSRCPRGGVNWANYKFLCNKQIIWLAQLTPCA